MYAGGDQGESMIFSGRPAAACASRSMGRISSSVREKSKRSSAASASSPSASYISAQKSQLSMWMRTRS